LKYHFHTFRKNSQQKTKKHKPPDKKPAIEPLSSLNHSKRQRAKRSPIPSTSSELNESDWEDNHKANTKKFVQVIKCFLHFSMIFRI